jgi:hypothetical protein
MTKKQISSRLPLVLGFLFSAGCTYNQAGRTLVARIPDAAPLIEDLVLFHSGILGDSVKIDGCSILQATGDEAILRRLSGRALASITSTRDCRAKTARRETYRRMLISVERYPDSAVANIEAKDGEYVHIASYKAVPIQNTGRLGFASVLLHDFGTGGSLPPPPPPPRKP